MLDLILPANKWRSSGWRIRGSRRSMGGSILRMLPCRGTARRRPERWTTDFNTLDRHGSFFVPETRDVVLLPDRVGGRYVALHRPLGDMPFCRPEMWIARSTDLVQWGDHRYLFGGAGDWEDGRVGAGAPPLAIPEGWLEIYHGNRSPEIVGEVACVLVRARCSWRRRSWRVLSEPRADS